MRLFARLLPLVLAGAVLSPGIYAPASADNPTPTDTVLPTATPTLAVATEAPVATTLPTVSSEQSTPIATVVSTVAAAPTSTPVAEATSTPFVAPIATPTPLPVPQPAPTSAVPSVNWPTPAQLRQDAQLRWGHGIPSEVRRWAFLIVPAAHRYHLDPNLIAAVMTMESGGDPLALSPADARGLMQILHGPWDPKTNVDLGARMLSSLYTQFGDWRLTLAAYNAGPGAVIEYGGIPPYRETRDYVVVVTYLWDLFGHHRLSVHRRQQYQNTLRDLQHFKDQRTKVTRLAHAADVAPPPVLGCGLGLCSQSTVPVAAAPGDPFWPVAGSPDPLQHVDPPVSP